MKKIAKYSLEELSKVMPALSEKEQVGYVGGKGGNVTCPYTEDEYEFLLSKDLWDGGYVRQVSNGGTNITISYIPSNHETYGSNSVYLGNGVYASQYDPSKDAAIIDNEAGKKDSEGGNSSTEKKDDYSNIPNPSSTKSYENYINDLRTNYNYTGGVVVMETDTSYNAKRGIAEYAVSSGKELDLLIVFDRRNGGYYIAKYNSSQKMYYFQTDKGKAALNEYSPNYTKLVILRKQQN